MKMLNKVNDTECAVCHQPIQKDRIHYGGVSCYSCRAFFRRNTQRDELPICKSNNNCHITYIDRKQCSACRYATCLRIGMKPELVLTEDDKKRRFKKFLQKKETESQMRRSDDDETSTSPPLPPLAPVDQSPKFSNFMSDVFHNNLRLFLAKRNNFLDLNTVHETKSEVLDLRTDVDNNKTSPGTNLVPVNPFTIFQQSNSIKQECEEFLKPSSAKDMEALKYFNRRGWFPADSSSLTSPDKSRLYSFSPMNQAELFTMPKRTVIQEDTRSRFNSERKSVITFPPTFKIKTEHIFGNTDAELSNEGEEEPQNLSLKREVSDTGDEDEDEFKYVHKKFRTQEKNEDENVVPSENQQYRQSVITFAKNLSM